MDGDELMNCDEMFPPGPLSFESNLDSLIDADFPLDSELPFPSQSQMSAHVNKGVDLIDVEGVGSVESAGYMKVSSENIAENSNNYFMNGFDDVEDPLNDSSNSDAGLVDSDKLWEVVSEDIAQNSNDSAIKDFVEVESSVGSPNSGVGFIESAKFWKVVSEDIAENSNNSDMNSFDGVERSVESSGRENDNDNHNDNPEVSDLITEDEDPNLGRVKEDIVQKGTDMMVKDENPNSGKVNEDINGTNLMIKDEDQIMNTKVDKIEHLDITKLKQKRKKKLAERSNNTTAKKSLTHSKKDEKKHGKLVDILEKPKKRKHEETYESSNEVIKSKKIRETNGISTNNSNESNKSNQLETNLNMKEEVEIDLEGNSDNSTSGIYIDNGLVHSKTDISIKEEQLVDIDDNSIENANTVNKVSENSLTTDTDIEGTVTDDNLKYQIDPVEDQDSTLTETNKNQLTLTGDGFGNDDSSMNNVYIERDFDADADANDNYDADDYENDLDENEVDAWLEEGVERGEKGEDEDGEEEDNGGEEGGQEDGEDEKKDPAEVASESDLGNGKFMTKEKFILQEKGNNPFEVLPEEWLMVMHDSGMPVYLHKLTRVCTMSRPYFIGNGSVRRHDIPISAVPCLQYKRELDKEKEGEQTLAQNASSETDVSAERPTPVMEKAVEKEVVLGAEELHSYCKSLFQFRSLKVKKFRTWREKRNHLREKYEQEKKLPKMAADTKLIVCPIPEAVSKTLPKKRKEFVINPEGKSPVCILHEYTQHVLRVQPVYQFSEIENQETPYKATIQIDGIGYGAGVGSCKRKAKADAAKRALKVFIPQLAEHWKSKEKQAQTIDLSYFEEVAIEDPRVTQLCDKAALPKPYQVLTECLRRNYGLGDTNLQVERKLISNQKTEFSLSVGKHTATVICRNKLEGKQRAAQAMLQKLHPQVKSWAAILRLYSKNTEVGFQEREEEAPQQSSVKDSQLLEKLKEAMRKSRNNQGNKNTSNFVCPRTMTADHRLDL